jgi:hypothetical protein
MPAPVKHGVRNEYAAWLATPKRLKVSLNLPSSKRAFADMKGVSERTLQRWEREESFKALVEQQQRRLAGATPNSAVAAIGPARPVTHGNGLKKLAPLEPVNIEDDPVFEESLSEDELGYRQVKDTLIGMARDGSSQAIDLYMKHYGKPFVDAEQQTANMFPEMSDEQLFAEVEKFAKRLAA